jgi:hypothetical protein
VCCICIWLVLQRDWHGAGVFRGALDCGWFSDYKFLEQPAMQPMQNFKKMINLMVPDSWSFQHFFDGSFPKLAQSWELVADDPDVTFMIESPRDSIIFKLFERLGVSRDQLAFHQHSVAFQAEQFHFSCATPPIHPYLWQKMQQIAGVRQIPFAERNRIAFMSRNIAGTHSNPGRHILNENDVLAAIRAFIADRDEVLEIYDHRNYPEFADNIEFFNRAKVIIGPHGGGM